MINILIVEDELPISTLIKLNLEDACYNCDCAYTGTSAIELIDSKNYDLILLDIMLPEINGYELFEYIKPLSIPVIFITAKNQTPDKVFGLNLGAEDYIVKPFEIIELLARINVVLRRYNKTSSTLQYLDISINTEKLSVTKAGKEISLTPMEFKLLVFLVRNKGITLFREKIYETLWETDYYGDTRTVDLHIQRLRKKLNLEQQLKTVYKIGYCLEG